MPSSKGPALLVSAGALLLGAVWMDGRARDRLLPPDAFRPVSVVGTGLWMVLLINIAGPDLPSTWCWWQ